MAIKVIISIYKRTTCKFGLSEIIPFKLFLKTQIFENKYTFGQQSSGFVCKQTRNFNLNIYYLLILVLNVHFGFMKCNSILMSLIDFSCYDPQNEGKLHRSLLSTFITHHQLPYFYRGWWESTLTMS